MIQVHKPEAPEILTTKGQAARDEMCTAYERGVREFDFDKAKEIYGHKTVKKALLKAQHGKCCYCEAKFSFTPEPESTANSPGDIEHFRPKSAYQQKTGDKLTKHGYYWLAYTWGNLFFSCEICNRSYKKNLFPLNNPTCRVASHHDDIDQEEPLFVHPANDNPEEFISFRGAVVFAAEGRSKGNATIKGTGLDRVELEERRSVFLETLQRLYEIATATPELPRSKDALEYLETCAAKESEFSSMVKANLADGFKFA